MHKYNYGYGQIDGSGNLDTSKNNGQLARIESFIGATRQWTQKFSYDSVGRLSEAKEYRGVLYRKNASNPTSGQENPLPYTPIENADIDKKFCVRYRKWVGRRKLSMRQTHRPAEKLFVDYGGKTIPNIDALCLRNLPLVSAID